MFLGVFGGPEIVVVAVLVLLLFGGKKLPELMKGLGKGVKEFKNATNSIKEEMEDVNPVNDIKKEIDDVNPMSDINQIGKKKEKKENGKKG